MDPMDPMDPNAGTEPERPESPERPVGPAEPVDPAGPEKPDATVPAELTRRSELESDTEKVLRGLNLGFPFSLGEDMVFE